MATDARPERDPGDLRRRRLREPLRDGRRSVRDRRPRPDHDLPLDHDYADFRRPHRVEFGDTIEVDLARRDFTVNAMAWGAPARRPAAPDPGRLVDPFGGRTDAAARLLRAVGEPAVRFEEDALRMVRAVRLRGDAGLRRSRPATLAAIQARGAARHTSPASASRPSSKSCSRPRGPRSGCGSWRQRTCSRSSRRSSPPSAASPRTRSRARTSGITRSGPSMPRRADRPGRPARGPPPRHRQAGDVRGGPFPRPRCRRGGAGASVPRRAPRAARGYGAGHSPRPEPHVQLRAELERRRGPAVHPPGRAATTSTSCSRSARRTTSAAGWTRKPTASRSCEHGSRRSSSGPGRPRPRRPCPRRRRPDGRAGPGPGPRLGRVLDELLERVIADPSINDRADAHGRRPEHASRARDDRAAAGRGAAARRGRPRSGGSRSTRRSPRPTRGTRSRLRRSSPVSLTLAAGGLPLSCCVVRLTSIPRIRQRSGSRWIGPSRRRRLRPRLRRPARRRRRSIGRACRRRRQARDDPCSARTARTLGSAGEDARRELDDR